MKHGYKYDLVPEALTIIGREQLFDHGVEYVFIHCLEVDSFHCSLFKVYITVSDIVYRHPSFQHRPEGRGFCSLLWTWLWEIYKNYDR